MKWAEMNAVDRSQSGLCLSLLAPFASRQSWTGSLRLRLASPPRQTDRQGPAGGASRAGRGGAKRRMQIQTHRQAAAGGHLRDLPHSHEAERDLKQPQRTCQPWALARPLTPRCATVRYRTARRGPFHLSRISQSSPASRCNRLCERRDSNEKTTIKIWYNVGRWLSRGDAVRSGKTMGGERRHRAGMELGQVSAGGDEKYAAWPPDWWAWC